MEALKCSLDSLAARYVRVQFFPACPSLYIRFAIIITHRGRQCDDEVIDRCESSGHTTAGTAVVLWSR